MSRLIELPSRKALREPPKSILYDAGGALGDTIVETRDLAHLRKAFPEAKIAVKLFPSNLAPIFIESGFDEFIFPNCNDPFAELYNHDLRLIEGSQCDAVFHSFGGPLNARIEYVNFDGVALPRRPVTRGTIGFFWEDDETPHVLDAREKFLEELLGVEPPDRNKIRLPKAMLEGDLKVLVESFVAHCKAPEKIVQISVSSSVPPIAARKGYGSPKTCSVEKWVSIAEELTRMGYAVIFTGGTKGGKVYSHNLKPGMLNLIEMLDLAELRGVMCSAPKVVVGGDSGPGHLASIMGIPTVSVFPSNGCPEYWSPGYAPNISLVSPTLHPDGVDNRLVIEAIEQMIKS